MTRTVTCFATLLLSLLAGTLLAQPPQRGQRGSGFGFQGFGNNGLIALTAMAEVQKELAITDEQKELLTTLQSDLRDQSRALFRGLGQGGGPGSQGNRAGGSNLEQMQSRTLAMVNRLDELVATVLEPEQLDRLKQLRLQREGVRAFDRPEFVKSLELSEEQVEQIKKLRAIANTGRPFGAPRSEAASKLDADVLAVLTDVQKEAWTKQKGQPFEFPAPPQFQRGGPGNNNDGNNNGNRPPQ